MNRVKVTLFIIFVVGLFVLIVAFLKLDNQVNAKEHVNLENVKQYVESIKSSNIGPKGTDSKANTQKQLNMVNGEQIHCSFVHSDSKYFPLNHTLENFEYEGTVDGLMAKLFQDHGMAIVLRYSIGSSAREKHLTIPSGDYTLREVFLELARVSEGDVRVILLPKMENPPEVPDGVYEIQTDYDLVILELN